MSAQIFLKLITASIIFTTAESTKWLIDNPGFDHPDSWFNGDLPCAKEDVIFPYRYRAVLPLPKEVDVSGFVLSREGALLLNQDAIINLGGDGKPERECNGFKGKSYLEMPSVRKWFDPHSWRTTTEMRQNAAMPHMERVPCNNESVIIQRNGPLTIDLENVPYMRVGQLSLAGSLISKDYLQQMMNTDIGQLLFKNTDGISVEYYRNDICGCHKNYENFVEPICHNVVATCERPHCLVPLTPLESCCAICGSILKFAVERCDDSNLHKLRKHIAMAISDQDLTDQLDYHVNYINSKQYGNHLQAVIVDRHSYSEKSVAFVKTLKTDWTKLFAEKHLLDMQFSGRPYNPNITFGSILLIILCLMLVTVVALIMFAHYAPDNQYLNRLPQWLLHPDPRCWRAFLLRSPFIFARFDNGAGGRVGGAGVGDTAETDMQEHIIMGYDAESGEVRERERAFDNPMFSENTQNLRAKNSEKDMGKVSKPSAEVKLETGNLSNEADDCEEQELTEIKLESSSDDSDEEKETKE